jgi:hypothetical protein
MSGTKRKDKASEERPKYISLYAYLDGALFAPAPGKDKNRQGMRRVGR